MRRWTKEETEQWLERNFVTCECGYRNRISKVQKTGICLACGKILDKKANFEYHFHKTRRKVK